MVVLDTVAIDGLLTYLLDSPEGREEFRFWDDNGEPDRLAARSFAENLRDQTQGHDEIVVEQRHHRVFVGVS